MDKRQLQLILKLKDEVSKEMKGIASQIDNTKSSSDLLSVSFKSLERIAVTTAKIIATAFAGGIGFGVHVASEIETATVGLETLLGSSDEARETMARLKKEAARTPFDLPGLSQATQLLTAVTKDGDKSIDILLDVGEGLAAMGKGQPELDRIIINLQQIAAVGHAATIDIKQFAFAGLPIYDMLAESTGKYGEELNQLIQNGGVTFDVLTKMFDEANDSGGRFFNAFKNQSGTFAQLMSNMKDSVGIFFADFVEKTGIFDVLKDSMQAVIDKFNYFGELLNSTSGFLGENSVFVEQIKNAWEDVVLLFEEALLPIWDELLITLQNPIIKEFIEVMKTEFAYALRIVIVAVSLLIIGLVKTIDILANVFIKTIEAVRFVIDKVSGVVTYFYEELIKLFDWVGKISDMFVSTFVTAIDKTTEAFSSFVTIVKEAYQWVVRLASKVGGGISKMVGGAIDLVLPGRELGGPVNSNSPYIVGEAGPELFVPRSSGSIIPNNKMGLGGSGISVNVVVNGDVSGQELVDKVQDSIMNNLRLNTKLSL